jgi:serine/threonine-protein kinase
MKPPEYLGPYRVGETLGKGGMGTVFRGRHAKSGEDVAVKLIAPHVSDEMRFRRRFHAEIETLKRLKHGNIVRLIGYGEEQGMLFYSMEFVAGETLQDIIRREKKLSWMMTLDVAIQVCAALKHAHDIGVIHRDLKPANLIVQADGTVKLVDFGISKIFGHSQTAAGSIMGTADYMSPEQASESGVTARTDLFSLGCVIYAMLCGRPPFRGKNITEVLTALKQRDPVPLDLIDPDLPEDIVQIVNELLEKNPADRPPTALAVMNRLKAMRAGLQRMQTLVDRPPDTNSAGQSPAEPASAEETNVPGDTPAAVGPQPEDKTVVGADKTKLGETVEHVSVTGNTPTIAEPSAATVQTDPRSRQPPTAAGTAATGSTAETSPPHSTEDTSAGASGQTHFQTVSDGEVRESIFNPPETKSEHPVLRIASIAALVLALLAGTALVIRSLRAPVADELLADIQQHDDPMSREAQELADRFLRLFPEHPGAEEVRDRRTAHQVEAAIRRLRLKRKLRTSESPLYEQAFLEAMELRSSDPAAAREQLIRWVDVFEDSEMSGEEEPKQLAALARFEADRLANLNGDTPTAAGDPKLRELMQRIDRAETLPTEERDKLLRGIVTLYGDQAWADEAVARAEALLDQPQS